MGIESVSFEPDANAGPREVQVSDDSLVIVQSVLARRIGHAGDRERPQYHSL